MRRLILICCALCAVFGPAALAKSPDLILKSADSNLNTMTAGELISVLEGNVVFLYDQAVIKSDYAKWWKSRGTVSFSRHVRVTQKQQRLNCNQLDYDKNKKWMTAEGNVDYFDAKQRTRITGRHGDYYPDSKLIIITGKPVLTYFDTTAHDTLVIRGEKMTYDDSLKIAEATKNVSICKGKMLSRSQEARYFSSTDKAQLRVSPHILYERDSLAGDSVDFTFSKRALRGMSVQGNSQGRYRELSRSDTMLTNVYGDSMYMALDDSGKVDSLWMYRNVKSVYFPLSKPLQTNEAYGKVMVVAFTPKGDVDKVKCWGNAKTIYHVEEGERGGYNNASGDSIDVGFKNGKTSHVKLSGSVRGFYAPEKKQEKPEKKEGKEKKEEKG